MHLFTRRIRIEIPTPTEAELSGALAIPESTPLWAAVHAVLDMHIADATAIARAPQTAAQPSLLAHTAGGLDALIALKEDLVARRQDALASPKAL